MKEVVVSALLFVGAIFTLLAAVGIVRFPDLYTRMQATTKAVTLGVGLLMLSVGIYFGESSTWVKAAAIILFLYLTMPVAAHVIARAAYFVGTTLWHGTVADELRGQYDVKTHELDSRGVDDF